MFGIVVAQPRDWELGGDTAARADAMSSIDGDVFEDEDEYERVESPEEDTPSGGVRAGRAFQRALAAVRDRPPPGARGARAPAPQSFFMRAGDLKLQRDRIKEKLEEKRLRRVQTAQAVVMTQAFVRGCQARRQLCRKRTEARLLESQAAAVRRMRRERAQRRLRVLRGVLQIQFAFRRRQRARAAAREAEEAAQRRRQRDAMAQKRRARVVERCVGGGASVGAVDFPTHPPVTLGSSQRPRSSAASAPGAAGAATCASRCSRSSGRRSGKPWRVCARSGSRGSGAP